MMSSTDYNPRASVLVPGTDSATMDATGAGNYGTAAPASAVPGADSAGIHSRNAAPNIGHDQTDAAALASVLEAKGTI